MSKEKKEKVPNWKKHLVPKRPNGSVDWDPPKEGKTKFPVSFDWRTRTRIEEELIDWQENVPFKAPLKFLTMFHGANSNTHATFEHVGVGSKYIMREEHLEECLQKGVLIHGVILGEWRFMRRGGRWSVVPIELISTIDLEQ